MIRRTTILVCMLWAGAATVGFAQGAPADSARLLDEVSGVNRSLQRLVALLDVLVEQQQTDILLKRIDMKARRLIPLESALRGTRAELTDANTELEQVKRMRDEWESSLREVVRDGKEEDAQQLRQMLSQVGPAVEAQETRVLELERRIRDLEDEIATHQRDLDVLDELLAERIKD